MTAARQWRAAHSPPRFRAAPVRTCCREVEIVLASSQAFVVVAIIVLGVMFESVVAVVACGVMYILIVSVVAVLVKWAANDFWLPHAWQLAVQVSCNAVCWHGVVLTWTHMRSSFATQTALIVIVFAGMLTTLILWAGEGKGSAAIVVFSCCYAFVFVACVMVAVSKQFHSSNLLHYYSTTVRCAAHTQARSGLPTPCWFAVVTQLPIVSPACPACWLRRCCRWWRLTRPTQRSARATRLCC